MEILRNRVLVGPKRAIQQGLRRVGIELRKFPSVKFRAVSVFDLAVHYLMERQGTRLNFVQIGANDGSYGDPLRPYVLRYPWHGILVEPQPDVFEISHSDDRGSRRDVLARLDALRQDDAGHRRDQGGVSKPSFR